MGDVEDVFDAARALVGGPSQWLWSQPLSVEGAEEDEEDEVSLTESDLEAEDLRGRYLSSQRTRSRAMAPGKSPSGRLYQNVQRSVVEFSRPTMSIRSSRSYWSTSPRPLPPVQDPLLTSWTRITNSPLLLPRSTNLASQSMGSEPLRPPTLMVESGTPRRSINSPSSTRVMVPPQLQVHSESPWRLKPKTLNR